MMRNEIRTMAEVGLADGDRVEIIADGTFGTAVRVMPLMVDVERDDGNSVRLRHADPSARVKPSAPSGKNWGHRCAPRGLSNYDGTCTVVAVYQLLRKTGLYPFINEELKGGIDGLLKSGAFDYGKRTCPKLPLAISAAYEALSGSSVVESLLDAGLHINVLFWAIVKESPGLTGQITPTHPVFISTQSMWRTQEIFSAIFTEKIYATLDTTKDNFMFCSVRDRYTNPDLTKGRDKQLDAATVRFACGQLRTLITYLHEYKEAGITGGVLGIEANRDGGEMYGHAITFVRCMDAFNFFNYGKQKTSTELAAMANTDILDFLTQSEQAVFAIDEVAYLWERDFCTNRELVTVVPREKPKRAEHAAAPKKRTLPTDTLLDGRAVLTVNLDNAKRMFKFPAHQANWVEYRSHLDSQNGARPHTSDMMNMCVKILDKYSLDWRSEEDTRTNLLSRGAAGNDNNGEAKFWQEGKMHAARRWTFDRVELPIRKKVLRAAAQLRELLCSCMYVPGRLKDAPCACEVVGWHSKRRKKRKLAGKGTLTATFTVPSAETSFYIAHLRTEDTAAQITECIEFLDRHAVGSDNSYYVLPDENVGGIPIGATFRQDNEQGQITRGTGRWTFDFKLLPPQRHDWVFDMVKKLRKLMCSCKHSPGRPKDAPCICGVVRWESFDTTFEDWTL
jgi:hypothetical protein